MVAQREKQQFLPLERFPGLCCKKFSWQVKPSCSAVKRSGFVDSGRAVSRLLSTRSAQYQKPVQRYALPNGCLVSQSAGVEIELDNLSYASKSPRLQRRIALPSDKHLEFGTQRQISAADLYA